MSSSIDVTKPADNGLRLASDIRALATSAKNDIEALQAAQASGSGTGFNLYLTGTSSGIGTYDLMSKVPDNTAEVSETVVVNNNTLTLDEYILDSELNRVNLNGGEWSFDFYHYVSSAVGDTYVTYEVYKRTSGGVETLLFSISSPILDNLTVANFVTKTIQQPFTVLPTDKLVLKVKATTSANSNVTVYLVHSGTSHYSHIMTPLVYTHNELEGKQGGTTNEYYHLTAAQHTNISNGVSGSFTSQDGKTVTVTNGIITSIV